VARQWILRGAIGLGWLIALLVLLALAYVAWVWWATRAGVAEVSGTRTGMPVQGPVSIARDARGVPHVRAGSIHDLFVAEGYAMASDRLFQMDVTRRYVDGRLAELLGSPVAAVDRRMRRYAIATIAADVYAHAAPDERNLLDAFAAGVNAAAATQPQPPEYRALFFNFERWKPEDSLAVGFATVLDLDDKPADVIVRDEVRSVLGEAAMEAFYPLTDPRYDVPTNGAPLGEIAKLPPLAGARENVAVVPADDRPPIGSNGWVVGADRTTVGKAVLANDPHLDLAIPTIWYLFEGSAPGMHVGGAALVGTPGVTLGHNEHLAWGVTAGETAAMRVLREKTRGDELLEGGRWVPAEHVHATIGVRFGSPIDAEYVKTPLGYVIAHAANGNDAYVLDWQMQRHPVSPLRPFLHLLTARTAAEGVAAMRAQPDPAINVLFADDAGNVAYHFAGAVPLEPAWGRWLDDGNDPEPRSLAYDDAPHVDPSRSAIVVTSNNRANGAGGPRLAPYWPPPYRAYEIYRALRASTDAHGRLSPDAIATEQRDATSPAEDEFAALVLAAATRKHADADETLTPLLSALRSFDGTLVPESRGATAVVALRRDLLGAIAAAHLPASLREHYPSSSPGFEVVLRALRERPAGWVPQDDYDAFVVAALHRVQTAFGAEIPPFSTYAAQPLTNALAAFGMRQWNGVTFPGRGGSFAPAVQWNGHGQSFRAVWIAGDWDNGTIDIDAGESGEPGSPHYQDQSPGWDRFARTPLPFSDAAVRNATRTTLTLTP
jgi:penicillin amidase